MNYFLVDFENVRNDGIKDMAGVKEGDTMLIFYSEQCKNITLDVLESITRLQLKLCTYKVKTGTKNALDFQLASYLGYLIGKDGSEASYHIVSNDKGFDCLCDYWTELGVNVNRISMQEEVKATVPAKPKASKTKKSKVKDQDLATIEEIKAVLSEDDEPDMVLQIFNQYKTKQAICNGMNKHFKDSKRTSAIYKKLKALLKEKNKS